MPVHIMGWVAPMKELVALSVEFGISIIEDAAEALGVYDLSGSHIGKDGIASVFSFNGNKILTSGGGGMIVTDNDEFAAHLKHLSTTAKTDSLRFVHDEVGYNYRLVNILAALGFSQLKKLPGKLKRKKEIFDQYSRFLNNKDLNVYIQNNCVSNHWLVNVIFLNSEMRESALNLLIKNNIQARPLWTPCHLQPAYSKYKNNKYSVINTESIWKKTLSLPSSPQLTNSQIESISSIIVSSFDSVLNAVNK